MPKLAAASVLDGGQITGVVLGSVGGAVVLCLLICLLCYVRANRRRQTGDLTWAKTSDLEAAAVGPGGQTPHEPLPGAPSSEQSTSGGAAGGAASQRASVISVANPAAAGMPPGSPDGGPSASMEAVQASPSDGVDFKRMTSRGRSTGSTLSALLGSSRGFLRGSVKDKHLEVSRSARVEPSAELEMTEPFEPAATNMGPPLSKSSMLLRWLNGADDGHAEAVAAQIAAAAAAEAAAAGDASGAKGALASGRSGRTHGVAATAAGGVVNGLNPFSDRVPLLSLAAQQSGIVWSKMPPSVASSPAVSMAESSSMHMLRGTWKRSDGPDEAALKTALASAPGAGANSSSSSAAWLQSGGDDRYPPSLALASVEALRKRNSMQSERPGIVFDYVMTTPTNSRAATSGGAPSRVPTIGGAVLPLPPTAEGGMVAQMSSSGGGAAGGVNQGSVGSSGGGAAPAAAAGGALLGHMPDENIFAQVLAQQPRLYIPPGPELSRPSGVWLHQGPPTKLAALREADTEGEAADESPAPAATTASMDAAVPAVVSPEAGSTPGSDVRAAELPSSPAPHTHLSFSSFSPATSSCASFSAANLSGGAADASGSALHAAALRSQHLAPPTAHRPAAIHQKHPAPAITAPTAAASGNAALPPAAASGRTGWTHFHEGDAWSSQRSTVNGGPLANGPNGTGGLGACLSPDTPMSLSAHGHLTPPGASKAASPLSPFLPRPPGVEEGSAEAAPVATTCTSTPTAADGAHTTTSDSGAAICRTSSPRQQAAGCAGMGGIHNVVLRANSAIASSSAAPSMGKPGSVGRQGSHGPLELPEGVSLAGEETVRAPPVSPGVVAAAAAAVAAAASSSSTVPAPDRMTAAPPPSMKRRVPAPAPVLPPSHSESLRSMPSRNSSISPSLGLHFPEAPLPWAVGDSGAPSRGAEAAGAADADAAAPGSFGASRRGSAVALAAGTLPPGSGSSGNGSVFVLPVSSNSKTTL